jgi:glycosyltransferase involved in cell wall biosynthesis
MEGNMKICLLNDSFPPVIDGVVNVLLNYADYLRRCHGAGIIVGTPEYPGADYDAYEYPVVAYPSLDTAAVTNGYRTGNPFSEKEISELASFAPDIIHSHCPASSTVIGRILREETGAPLVMTYHTKYDIDIDRVIPFPPAQKTSLRFLAHNLSQMDEIWAVTQSGGEAMGNVGFHGSFRVMENGTDFAFGRAPEKEVAALRESLHVQEGELVFLFVGRLLWYKNLRLILDGLKRARDAGLRFRAVFVGGGADEPAIHRYARSLGLKDCCIFPGPVFDREALRGYYTLADLFLFPSTFDTSGIVVKEAAACACPALLTRGACAAEGTIDGVNAFLAEENAASFASVLLAACREPGKLQAVGERAGRDLYRSWDMAVDEAVARYRVLLKQWDQKLHQ